MGNMFKSVGFFAAFNERTGFGNHAVFLCRELEKLIPVQRNVPGDVNISLLDVVTASHTTVQRPYPSILYTVWESTEYPAEFLDKLKLYDQMWVPSEWEKECAIKQGIPEEFVKVVHEGVDPDVFKPVSHETLRNNFNFVHVGQWQPRKSTREICEAFLKAFPDKWDVRLYLSADTLFPSDAYKSTEERLNAYSVNDSRIIPIHFEDRTQYIERLRTAHVFVSCSRAEGWGLPICEAMACGIPTIVADWSGSTEYAFDALKVRVPNFKKPAGIYGNWNVPGVWGEPDYDHLVEVMRDVYENYATHKEKALVLSEMIRKYFSWEAAAKQAYRHLEAIAARPEIPMPNYTKSAIFAVDCWPSSEGKMNSLIETIQQVHEAGYPILVSSHYPLPPQITELADFYLYEKQDIMSGDDKPVYWRQRLDGTVESKPCSKEYQGVAAINCFRNAIDFCRGRYDWVYQMSADMEVDLNEWLSLVHTASKPMVCIPYEGNQGGIGGGLWAGRTEILDQVIPRLASWKQYADAYPEEKFCAEKWLYRHIASLIPIDDYVDWITIDTRNRFDNVDWDVWPDDDFQCHFVEGPYLNIIGLSKREYDVEFTAADSAHKQADHITKLSCGMWSRPNAKYYRPWTVTAKLDGQIKYQHTLALKDKNVIISMGSKALGDTIAWMPYVEEFRKKHGCHIKCSTWWNNILDYPEIEFVKPGDVIEGIYASYEVGCYDEQPDRNPTNWRMVPLQKVAADILGLDYEPLRARLKYKPYVPKSNGHAPRPYICFSEHSTMQNKCWNREGAWQTTIDYLIGLGYDCISISNEPSPLNGVINHCGQSIEQTLTDLSGASFYIGLNAGPSWLAYAMDLPVIMITGVSEPWNDFPNPYRVSVDVCRPGCFNAADIPINRDWAWCPREKNFACTREITEDMVKTQIDRIHWQIDQIGPESQYKEITL